MPVYEYICSVCGKVTEKLIHNIYQELPAMSCPECRVKMERKLSVFNHSVGWRFTEASHIEGNPDEVEKDL